MCLRAGILDVEAWMMEVDKRVLDFWEAFDRIEPLPDSWMQSAQICRQIEKSISFRLASHGQEYEPEPLDSFMPPRWVPPKRPATPAQSKDEQIAALDKAFDR